MRVLWTSRCSEAGRCERPVARRTFRQELQDRRGWVRLVKQSQRSAPTVVPEAAGAQVQVRAAASWRICASDWASIVRTAGRKDGRWVVYAGRACWRPSAPLSTVSQHSHDPFGALGGQAACGVSGVLGAGLVDCGRGAPGRLFSAIGLAYYPGD